MRRGITFGDVLLEPRRSRIRSRKDVETRTRLSKRIELNIPLVSANMDTVAESNMARAMALFGGIGIIHRFLPIHVQAAEVRKVKRSQHFVIEGPITVYPQTPLSTILETMKRESVSGVLVVKPSGHGEDILQGIISARDLLFESDMEKGAAEIMTRELITAEETVTFDEARVLFAKEKIEKLPLVGKHGELKGLITSRDILNVSNDSNAAKDDKGRLLVGAALGVKADTLARAKALASEGVDVLVIDIAHGHNMRVVETIEMIRADLGQDIDIVAGNIATKEAARDLIKAGASALKVGIGPGAACTTRIVTGVGVPQLTAIKDVVSIAQRHGIPVIADGGVRNSGDFSKALAAGASTVMVEENLLAGTRESPGEYTIDRGVAYKSYRGMASADASEDKEKLPGEAKDSMTSAPEGASGRIPFKGDVSMVVGDLMAGLRSSMSYLGASNLKQFSRNARFIEVTPAGIEESRPHGVE